MRRQGDFAIVGAVRLVDYRPAFALPIAASASQPGTYFLAVTEENSQKISKFIPLYDFIEADLVVQDDQPVHINGDYIHAFIDRNEAIYLHTASDLAPTLRVELAREETPLATKIAIAELLCDRETLRGLRTERLSAIGDMGGDRSGQAYIDSAARTRLWDLLIAAAAGGEAKGRIRQHRSVLTATVSPKGEVSIDVSAIDPVTDLAIPVSEIESALNEEFGGIRRQARAPRLLDLSRYGMDPTSGQLLEAAGLSPRPTERAAVLMRALLIYSVVGLSALRRFDDVAPIVIGAVGSLRRAVSEQTRPHEAERAVADAIRLIFEELPPAERGEIIFHGAAYLSDFAEVRAALSDLMSLTSDAALAPYKEDVEQFLRDQGRRRRT